MEHARVDLAYRNGSCRTQVVEFWGWAPYIRMRCGPGNIWVRRFQVTAAIDQYPERYPPGDDSAAVRVNHSNSMPSGSYHDSSVPVHTAVFARYVRPGQTLRMRHIYWWRSDTFTRNSVNLVHLPYIGIRYRALPVS